MADEIKEVTVEDLAGVPAGTEVRGEVVVADIEDGIVIGWHKESVGK